MAQFRNPVGARFVDTKARGAFIAEVLKSGKKLLVVGGEMQKMVPRELRDHRQVVIWDDNKRNIEGREVPPTTGVILFSQWTSHGVAWKLRKAATKIGATIFAMLNTKQVKETLQYAVDSDIVVTADVMQAELQRAKQQEEELLAPPPPLPPPPPPPPPKAVEPTIVIERQLGWKPVGKEAEPPPRKVEGWMAQAEAAATTTATPELEPEPVEPSKRRPSRLGEIPAFLTYFLQEGKAADEARRLLPKLHALGIEQTEANLRTSITKYRKLLKTGLDRSSGPGATVALAIEEAQAGRYRFDGKLPKGVSAAPELSLSPSAAKDLLESIGKLDIDGVEQLVKNALEELRAVQPILEKLKDILPALELVFGEIPKVRAEIVRLNKIREALK